MKIHPLFCILFILFISCSSTTLIQHTDSAYEEVNSELKGETILLKNVNGEETFGQYVTIFQDSIILDSITIAIENIEEIQVKNHSKGTWAGIGLGYILGGMAGTLIEKMLSKSDGKYTGVGGAFIGILAGMIYGGIYGGNKGVTDYYIFAPLNMKKQENNDIKEQTF